ncbi:unnamed protein product [Ilex paraguariensis]|uniref:N-acetyltransferase domain-containing protein n=1 Tax=Ilex paraguariensis TaxID=185542 RepID=A0ABC8SKP4_9AQUA
MSLKIAEESLPNPLVGMVECLVVVREYDEKRDKVAVEELERRCQFGQPGKPSIIIDLMGDPISRLRNFPSHVMMVAEYGKEREIAGIISGGIKTVRRAKKDMNDFPVYVKLACILGLRVSPTHRRLGIGTKLVQHLEEWCRKNGADYTYMATDCSNLPSIDLFTVKCEYVKFRTPAMLVHPVHAHYKPLDPGVAIVQVPPRLAELIYSRIFANSEFFPKDIDFILNNKLNLGTFMALPKKSLPICDSKTDILPQSFAILSVWNTKEVFKLVVKGVSALTYAFCMGTWVLDTLMPWLKLPSIPNIFSPFGIYFLYGLHMEGKGASRLMRCLCTFVHNMARDDTDCGALVAEVGKRDPLIEAIPHWKKFSWDEDVWCIKRLKAVKQEDEESCGPSDLIKSRPSSSVIFVDPRDF